MLHAGSRDTDSAINSNTTTRQVEGATIDFRATSRVDTDIPGPNNTAEYTISGYAIVYARGTGSAGA